MRFLNFARSHMTYYHPRFNFLSNGQIRCGNSGENTFHVLLAAGTTIFMTSWVVRRYVDPSLIPDYTQYPYTIRNLQKS